MTLLILAALAFVGGHLLLSATPLRAGIISLVGENAYLAIFSAIALAAIILMSMGYSDADYVHLWDSGHAFKGITWLVMVPAVLFVVCANSTPNPTSVGSQAVLERDDAARGIFSITRQPMMWGIALWAGAHLLSNGDLASLIFFGSILILVFAGAASQEARKRAKAGAVWDRFAAQTSFVPFVAIARGRRSLDWRGIGWRRFGGAIILYAALVFLHGPVIGVSPIPG